MIYHVAAKQSCQIHETNVIKAEYDSEEPTGKLKLLDCISDRCLATETPVSDCSWQLHKPHIQPERMQ